MLTCIHKPELQLFVAYETDMMCVCVCVCVCVLSHQVVSDSLWPHSMGPTRLLCPWDFLARILEGGAIFFCRVYSWPRDQTHISYASWQADSLPLAQPGTDRYCCLAIAVQSFMFWCSISSQDVIPRMSLWGWDQMFIHSFWHQQYQCSLLQVSFMVSEKWKTVPQNGF